MKAKKILATTLAVATMTSMMSIPVLADTIEGGTVYIDQDVYNVVLPTTASMKFYLDPQGLTTLGSDGTPGSSKGTIVGASLDMHAINKSNAPVALSAKYTLEAKKTDDTAATDITVVDTFADADAITALRNSTDKKVAVSVAAATDATTYTAGKAWKAVADETDITGTSMSAADTVYAKQTTGESVNYIMDKATYTAKMKDGATDKYDPNSYEMEYTANTGTDLKLTIGGYCSEKADWSAYAKGDEKLTLSAVFGFKKVDNSTADKTTIKTDEIEVVPEVTPDQDVTVTFSEAITATNTIITPPQGTVYSVTQSDIDSGQVVGVNGNSLTVKTFALSIWEHTAGYGKGTYTVTLTKTDGTKENKTFVLK